jgi:hypothetical protein
MITPKRKNFTFWVYEKDYRLTDFLVQKVNVSDYVKDTLTKVMNGDLIPRTNEDLKRKKIDIDIEYKKTQIELNKLKILYYNTFESDPSIRAKKVMKINVNDQIETPSCFDESNHRIMCPECGSCFVFAVDQHDIPNAKELFIDHYIQKHGLKFPPQLELELKSF